MLVTSNGSYGGSVGGAFFEMFHPVRCARNETAVACGRFESIRESEHRHCLHRRDGAPSSYDVASASTVVGAMFSGVACTAACTKASGSLNHT